MTRSDQQAPRQIPTMVKVLKSLELHQGRATAARHELRGDGNFCPAVTVLTPTPQVDENLGESLSTMFVRDVRRTRQELPGSGNSCRVDRQFLPPSMSTAFETKA